MTKPPSTTRGLAFPIALESPPVIIKPQGPNATGPEKVEQIPYSDRVVASCANTRMVKSSGA